MNGVGIIVVFYSLPVFLSSILNPNFLDLLISVIFLVLLIPDCGRFMRPFGVARDGQEIFG